MSAIPTQFDRRQRSCIQMALNEHTKSNLVIDGDFGPRSVGVLKKFQEQCKLTVTGQYDAGTQRLLEPFIKEKYYTEQDLVQATKELECDLPSVKSVVEVESSGAGFFPSGQCAILFERHWMRRNLLKAFPAEKVDFMQTQYPTIISSNAGGYVGGQSEWERFKLASSVELTSAQLSTSWGLFQIMGFNHKACGYSDVNSFVQDMCKSERYQLRAFVNFIKADKALHQALIRRDWPSFAARYNGPAYAKNQYDIKLAAAYKKFVG